MGNLCDAVLRTLWAASLSRPVISNNISPGWTTATQYFNDPLPDPMRDSAARSVIGLSGKIRIQIFPVLRTARMILRRVASICRDVIQPASSPLSP